MTSMMSRAGSNIGGESRRPSRHRRRNWPARPSRGGNRGSNSLGHVKDFNRLVHYQPACIPAFVPLSKAAMC
jgi:hypothetical protein